MPPLLVSSPPQTATSDRLGIALSGLCALHCVLMPVALSALPLWPATEVMHDWLHPVLTVFLLPVTFWAMGRARHAVRTVRIWTLLGVGLALVLTALGLHETLGAVGETAMTFAGSSLLIAGHVLNARATHHHPHED